MVFTVRVVLNPSPLIHDHHIIDTVKIRRLSRGTTDMSMARIRVLLVLGVALIVHTRHLVATPSQDRVLRGGGGQLPVVRVLRVLRVRVKVPRLTRAKNHREQNPQLHCSYCTGSLQHVSTNAGTTAWWISR